MCSSLVARIAFAGGGGGWEYEKRIVKREQVQQQERKSQPCHNHNSHLA